METENFGSVRRGGGGGEEKLNVNALSVVLIPKSWGLLLRASLLLVLIQKDPWINIFSLTLKHLK